MGDGGGSGQTAATREIAAAQGVGDALDGLDVGSTQLPGQLIRAWMRYKPVQPLWIEICLTYANPDRADSPLPLSYGKGRGRIAWVAEDLPW